MSTLDAIRPAAVTDLDPIPAVVVEGLGKSYGEVAAVADLSFTVGRRRTVALLGPNGAGKTTTIAMLLGLLEPSRGTIAILGEPMPRGRRRVLPRMNFTSPYVDLPQRLTVRQNLSIYSDLYAVARPKERIAELARDLDLRRVPRPPVRPPLGGAEDPGAAGQVPDQRARATAARRAHRLARPRHRRPAARPSRALPGPHPAPPCSWRRTTWARSSAWRTMS